MLNNNKQIYKIMSQVAQTILQQLGGNKFLAMTGAHNLGAGENYLQMKLRKSNSKAQYLIITLMPNDTYKMEFVKLNRQLDRTIVKQYDDVYFDMLQKLFTEETGMYTKL